MTVLDSPAPPGSDISEIGLISADSHVNEPRDLWSSNLPPSLRSQAMQGIESGEDGSWKNWPWPNVPALSPKCK